MNQQEFNKKWGTESWQIGLRSGNKELIEEIIDDLKGVVMKGCQTCENMGAPPQPPCRIDQKQVAQDGKCPYCRFKLNPTLDGLQCPHCGLVFRYNPECQYLWGGAPKVKPSYS